MFLREESKGDVLGELTAGDQVWMGRLRRTEASWVETVQKQPTQNAGHCGNALKVTSNVSSPVLAALVTTCHLWLKNHGWRKLRTSLESKKETALDISQDLHSCGLGLQVGAILAVSLPSQEVTQHFSEALGQLSLVPCHAETP